MKYKKNILNYEINIYKSKLIKNPKIKINIYGEIFVSVPKYFKNRDIELFTKININFIEKSIDKIKKKFDIKKLEYIDGEKHFLWGYKYELKILNNEISKSKIEFKDDKIIISSNKILTLEEKQKIIEKFYKKELESRLKNIIDKFEKITNLKANEYRIKKMNTRWGTCNITKKRIWLNLYLAKRDISCLELVLVHELLHFKEKYHNKNFYNLIEFFYPNYEYAEQKLKEIIV